MANVINTHDETPSYVIDPQEATEAEQLLLQERSITKVMGGVFPADFTPTPGQTVLDLACGPGGWALDVARAYPRIEVIGVDTSRKMIRFAQARARALGLPNVSFQVMDKLDPLGFPEDAFEFVNARFVSTFLSKDVWPRLVQECLRVSHPGGVIRLTDGEWTFSNGEASERYAALLKHAVWLAGRSFGPEGGMHGITLMLSHFLRQAGLMNIRQHAYALDYSYGTEELETWYQNTLMAFPRVTGWLTHLGLTTREEFERLCDRVSVEMQEPDFRAMLFFLSVWGTKPARS